MGGGCPGARVGGCETHGERWGEELTCGPGRSAAGERERRGGCWKAVEGWAVGRKWASGRLGHREGAGPAEGKACGPKIKKGGRGK